MTLGHFVMQTPAHYQFPNFFLTLGARVPPYDHPYDRVSNQPILTSKRLVEMAAGVGAQGEIAIFGSLGPDKGSVVQVMLDFILPGFMTLEALSETIRGKKLRWFASGIEKCQCLDVVKALTGEIPSRYPTGNNLIIFEHAILGLVKVDAVRDASRPQQDAFLHKYEFSPGIARRMSEKVLAKLKIPTRRNETVVTFLDIKSRSQLSISNLRELIQLVSRTCAFCAVEVLNLEMTEPSRLLEKMTQTTVLIARSGMGLGYAVWLQPGAFVFELRPYGFWCDDTPKWVAQAADVEYYEIMSGGTIPPDVPLDSAAITVRKCRSAHSYCSSFECNRVLIEQPSVFESEIFNRTWQVILNKLAPPVS
jgi:hypothetical protein